MRPWECSQTDGQTDRQTDTHRPTLTDANRFYNLSHAICYSYGTDKNKMSRFYGSLCKYLKVCKKVYLLNFIPRYVFASSGRPPVHPSVRYSAWRDFSSLSEGILMKLGTSFHHETGHCRKGFRNHGVTYPSQRLTDMEILWNWKRQPEPLKEMGPKLVTHRPWTNWLRFQADGFNGQGDGNVRGRRHTNCIIYGSPSNSRRRISSGNMCCGR